MIYYTIGCPCKEESSSFKTITVCDVTSYKYIISLGAVFDYKMEMFEHAPATA